MMIKTYINDKLNKIIFKILTDRITEILINHLNSLRVVIYNGCPFHNVYQVNTEKNTYQELEQF